MKKIIFCDIPMKSNLKPMVYKGTVPPSAI